MYAKVNEQSGAVGLTDDFREAASWLEQNTNKGARIIAWTPGVGGTVADSSRTLIKASTADLAKFFLSDESVSYKMAREWNANYVVAVFGGRSAFPNDD